ncbi:MAG: response regulator [Bdellovibrionales bacterium]
MQAKDKTQQKYIDRPHVLVVDDDVRICDLVSRYLMREGFVVLTAHHAAEARAVLDVFAFDAIVCDVMMPGEDGMAFTRGLRDSSDIPVLLLTALGEVDDRIKGLEAGADDYLAKPFEPRELVLRLQAILKRQVKAVEAEAASFQIGPWVFDVENAVLSGADGARDLTAVEANLLHVLAKHGGEVLSRDDLARLCKIKAGERAIDVQVTRLRRKIEGDSKAPEYLQTVRGKGYVLKGVL